VADRLGFAYVDTGAFYRAIGLFCAEDGADLDNPQDVESRLPGVSISVRYDNSRQQTYINGRDVTADIRTQAAADGASKVARVPGLREKVVELARSISKDEDVVMDGRDIGTVVLPNADLKIYLDASIQTRTHRRVSELLNNGQPAEFEVVMKEIAERDYRDKTREISPLRVADDAVVIDSSDMSAEQVCDVIIAELTRIS